MTYCDRNWSYNLQKFLTLLVQKVQILGVSKIVNQDPDYKSVFNSYIKYLEKWCNGVTNFLKLTKLMALPIPCSRSIFVLETLKF